MYDNLLNPSNCFHQSELGIPLSIRGLCSFVDYISGWPSRSGNLPTLYSRTKQPIDREFASPIKEWVYETAQQRTVYMFVTIIFCLVKMVHTFTQPDAVVVM